MPEAQLYITGKPDDAGGPLQDIHTLGSRRRPEALMCVYGEARHSGRPCDTIHRKIVGGRSMPEAELYTTGKPDDAGGPLEDLHTLGSRRMAEALMCVYGKPDRAGGPSRNRLQNTWRPGHAGGHLVYN